MGKIGFTCYETPVVEPKPTIAEIIVSLNNTQKLAILNGFANKVKPDVLYFNLRGKVPREAIKALYRAIDEIEMYSRALMREEVELTPAEIDPETGEIITPAVMNTIPSTVTALKSAVSAEYSVDFNATQVGAIINKMISCTKLDGTGSFAFYKANVIL